MHHTPSPPPFAADSMAYELFYTVRALGRAIRGRAQAAGLNRSRGMILGQLAHGSGGVTATDLRRCMGVTAASISPSTPASPAATKDIIGVGVIDQEGLAPSADTEAPSDKNWMPETSAPTETPGEASDREGEENL